MSSSSNVVVMPPAPAGRAPTQPGAPAPQAQPGQQWWGGYPGQPIYPGTPPPGCAPAGCPPNSLMQCYCDVQNATAFITAIMIDAINNNPAVTDAIIAAIEKSGSTLPLIGVTNGTPAQPGQVGEVVVLYNQNFVYGVGNTSSTVNMGVLQPGDWDVWCYALATTTFAAFSMIQNPVPAGFQNPLLGFTGSVTTEESAFVLTDTIPALTSVPSLIVLDVTIETAPAAGNAGIAVYCRRRR